MLQASDSGSQVPVFAQSPAQVGLVRQLLAGWSPPKGRSIAERVEALHKISGVLCASHGYQLQVEGSVPNEPVVLVANHVSYIDPLLVSSVTGCAPIAKEELRSWPLIGEFAAQYGVTFVRRGDPMNEAVTLRKALRILSSGVNVLNFPEGTTSIDEVLPFRRGIFGIAKRASVPVVPIALIPRDKQLAWVGDAAFLPHYLRALVTRPHHFRVVIGAPMDPKRFAEPAQMAESARSWIREQVVS